MSAVHAVPVPLVDCVPEHVRSRRRFGRRAIATKARPEGNGQYRIDGEKTWISNGGIAAHYIVFARTGEGEGARGLSAFLVDAGTPGLEIAELLDLMAPHPMARIRFDGCRVPANHLLGKPGEGFGKAYREVIGRHFPAMAAVEVSGLIEPEALVEIEAMAVVPD